MIDTNNSEILEAEIEQAFSQINRLSDRGRLKRALKLCRELYLKYPEHPRVLHGMGLLLYRCEDKQEGERLIRKAIELKPDFADAYFNLGNIYRHLWKFDEAEQLLHQALEVDPDHFKALSSLALLLSKRKKYQEALQCCEKSIAINPRFPIAYVAKGTVLTECGNAEEGVRLYRKALQLKKDNDGQSALIFLMNLVLGISQEDIFKETVAWSKRYTDPLWVKSRGHLNTPSSGRTIRIGYLSGDFKLHPVSHHLKPVLAAHDSSRFAVYLYNNSTHTDELTEELAGYCRFHRDISLLDDDKAESLIRNDCIDILIDLSGHTAYHRLSLFARKPAPIQASWIGYFNTTGMMSIDYLISDPITIPVGEDGLFSERIVRLPDCRFCFAAPSYAPEVAPLPAQRTGGVTFGSFNKLAKTNSEVIGLWARVLNAVPGSKMIIKWSSIDDTCVQEGFISRFASLGVAADRLILRNDTPHPEMLAEYGDVDIALDTFPYNGGATTCEALWMGVPVVTLEGLTPISRQSKAFLHVIGHPEWVASNPDEYLNIAVDLASDVDALARIRNGLRQQMTDSPLCDGKTFTNNLEEAYREMWGKWCREQSGRQLTSSDLKRFNADDLYNAGCISMDDGDYQHAANLFMAVTRRQPGNYQAWNNSGICHFNLGRTEDARRSFTRAIRIEKSDGKAYNNLGRIMLETGQHRTALKLCKSAVELLPDHADSLVNLGIAYRNVGRIQQARQAFERVIELESANTLAMNNLSNLLLKSGRAEDAVDLLKKALSLEPTNLDVISTCLFYMQNIPDTSNAELAELSRLFACAVNELLPSEVDDSHVSDHEGPKEKLRIGFVSPDFRLHPVGYLLSSYITHHDPERISFFCYSNSRWQDGLTEWYKSKCCGWRDIFSLDDRQVAAQVIDDGIDILVDLSGHTSGNRLAMFALRPAPVQVTWMGYAHTTGLEAMDYIIADDDYIPSADEVWFSEKVVRLPHNRFCFSPPTPSPFVVEPPSMENGYVTFGCFNNLGKLNANVLTTWSLILKRVPKSRLILKSKSFSDPAVRRWYRDEFRNRGINPRRIELRSNSPYNFMLAEYGEIDIVLDPFPYTGGMTSLETLWMGVPIITMTGYLPISRQTASFLKLVGLSQMITANTNEYIAQAIHLASDSGLLRTIRESLRERMINSPLCDAKVYARNVENLLFDLWNTTALKALKHNL